MTLDPILLIQTFTSLYVHVFHHSISISSRKQPLGEIQTLKLN